jgi:septal ring factor EnvC (AmiA/AmiB activator)
VVLLAVPAAAQKRDDLSSEQKKLQQTQRQLRDEREKAAEAKKREISLLAELEEIDQRLVLKRREIVRLTGRIREVEAELQTLGADIKKLGNRQSFQQEALRERLRAMYRIQAQGGAAPAILGEDAGSRAGLIRYLATMAVVDTRLIRDYRRTSDALANRTAREESRAASLADLRRAAEAQRVEVDREAARRRVLLVKVKDERQYHERMVAELTEASRKLEAFIRELQEKQRRVAKAPPPAAPSPGTPPPAVGFGTLRGRLPWPTEGRLVAGFGAQVHPRFGTRTFKSGVDIEASDGTDVRAVYAGHVVYSGWFKGYGNLVILDHGHEYFTLYAHLTDVAVKEGDDVRQGQRLAGVGDSGSLAGPRLYFEVRYQGKPQDPEQWLRHRG